MIEILIRRLLPTGFLAALLAAGPAACGNSTADTAEAEGEEHAEENAGEGGDVVRLDSAALAAAGIEVGVADAVTTATLPVTGTITYDANRVSHIGPRTDGRIVALRADIGDRVKRGQVLAVLESPEVGALRAELHQAEALVGIARENYQREKRLEEQGISSRKELLEAEAELRRAQAAALSAGERLRALGAGHGEGGQFAITAPFDGVVVEKHARLGEVASPSDRLFTVADLSRVWIELDIYERDLSRVAVGQPVAVTTAAYPGRTFPGRIVYLGDVLDPERRTVRARVEIPNTGRALKPGMFAKATIQVGGGGAPLVVVPQDAVQEIDGRQVVFVPGERAGEFRPVPVEVGQPLDGGRVAVLSGLAPGSRLVVSGAFLLKSELAKGEIGEHGH